MQDLDDIIAKLYDELQSAKSPPVDIFSNLPVFQKEISKVLPLFKGSNRLPSTLLELLLSRHLLTSLISLTSARPGWLERIKSSLSSLQSSSTGGRKKKKDENELEKALEHVLRLMEQPDAAVVPIREMLDHLDKRIALSPDEDDDDNVVTRFYPVNLNDVRAYSTHQLDVTAGLLQQLLIDEQLLPPSDKWGSLTDWDHLKPEELLVKDKGGATRMERAQEAIRKHNKQDLDSLRTLCVKALDLLTLQVNNTPHQDSHTQPESWLTRLSDSTTPLIPPSPFC